MAKSSVKIPGITKKHQRAKAKDDAAQMRSAAVAKVSAADATGKVVKLAERTFDSFQNFALKLGMGTDNALTGSTYGFNPITRQRVLLEWMHRGTWLGGIAIDLVADDMTRAGIDINTELEPDKLEVLQHSIVRLHVWPSLNEVVQWARLYGGCLGFLMIDGQDPSTPLRVETVGKGAFRGILPFDRWMVDALISQGQLVTEFGPDFGLPRFYRTLNLPGIPQMLIHHSRIVRVEGVKLPYNQRIMENLWGLSVLERLNDRMIAFDSATTGAAQLVYKSFLRTIKVKNLREIVANGGKAYQGLIAQILAMSQFQSIEGVTLLDGDDEFEAANTANFSGISDALQHFIQQLAGALQIPLTRLLGQSPGGLNSTGESDLRTYYDGIKQQQESTLRDGVHKIYRVAAQSLGTPLDESFNFEFKSLWQMSDQQQAEVSQRDTESVLLARERGLIGDQLALQELRQRGRSANRWTNITDEIISQAEEKPAPKIGAEESQGEEKSERSNVVKPPAPKKRAGDARRFADMGFEEYPPKVRLAIEHPEVDRDYDVRWMAVSARAGGHTHIDRRVPLRVQIGGKIIDPAIPLNTHEQVERYEMAENGRSYLEAHRIATAAERTTVEAMGADWAAWLAWCRGMLAHLEHEGVHNPPPDPHVRPDHRGSLVLAKDAALPMIEVAGMPIVIECHAGERRWAGGPIHSADYGHIWGTSSTEGRHEAMDCFIGQQENSTAAWVIDQFDKDTHELDEHKVMLCFASEEEANAAWDQVYGNSHMVRGKTTLVDFPTLKTWLRSGSFREPFGREAAE